MCNLDKEIILATFIKKGMIINLPDYYHNIHSGFGEDGVLYCVFRIIGLHKVPTFINITNRYTRKNIFETFIRLFKFESNIKKPAVCTIDDIREISFRHPNTLDLVGINSGGVEYWLLRALLERVKPNVICCRINHVIPLEQSVSAPYVPDNKRAELFDNNYNGVSLGGLKTLLGKEYVFIGVSRFAVFAFFVKKALVPPDVEFKEMNLKDISAVKHAQEHRWPLVAKKFWITIK